MTFTALNAWGFPADWSSPVEESFSFRTSIIESANGREQRIAQRTVPRISYSFQVWLNDPAMRHLSGRFGGSLDQVIWIPHPRHFVRLSADSSGTDLTFAGAPPAWMTADSVVFFDAPHAAVREARQVSTVGATGVTLTAEPGQVYLDGTRIYRGVPCRWNRGPVVQSRSSRAGRFEVSVDGDPVLNWTGGYPTAQVATVGSREYFNLSPDWSAAPQSGIVDDWQDIDFRKGAVARVDRITHPVQTRRYRYLLYNETRLNHLVGLFHRTLGRQKAFYMPSFLHDLTPVTTLSSGARTFDVEGAEAAAVFNDNSVFRRLRFLDSTGSFVRTVSSVTENSGKSRFQLVSGLPRAVTDLKMLSWLTRVRFDQDSLSIQWRSDGVGECQIRVRTLPDN